MPNQSLSLEQIRKRIQFLVSLPAASQHFKTYAPTFIIGAPRSGTTLTLKLFDNQPSITTLFEPWKFWRTAFRWGEDDSYNSRLNWLGFQVLKYLYYQATTIDKPYLVVKDPRDSIRINSLNSLFPNAKFIHIIRDGRDVVASMMKTFRNEIYLTPEEAWPHVRIPNYKTMFDNPPHINAAIQWKYCVETSLKSLSTIPKDRQLTFLYEDLITHPQKISLEILNFAFPEIKIDQAVREKLINSISNQVVKNIEQSKITNTHKKLSWEEKKNQFSSLVKNDAGSGTTADFLRVGRWKTELDESILSEIQPIMGDTLKQLGYQ